jgi:predicted RNase H-like HicB family nuclease
MISLLSNKMEEIFQSRIFSKPKWPPVIPAGQKTVNDDSEEYYAHVPGLQGVWATGKTFEECRKELISTIEGWIVLGLRMGQTIQPHFSQRKGGNTHRLVNTTTPRR